MTTVRLGKRLQPGGEVRRLADDRVLLRGTLADQIADHDQPGGDADPHAQSLSRRQSADRLDEREAGAHRPLGVVLVRLRVAEIDQHPVAHVLGDKAVEAGDRLGDRAVVGADDLAQVLGVEPRRERGRADQIAEHHRELPAFGVDLSERRRGQMSRSPLTEPRLGAPSPGRRSRQAACAGGRSR